jgi:hypothetical protein
VPPGTPTRVAKPGRDEHDRETGGRAFIGIAISLRPGVPVQVIRCPTCGTDNEIDHQAIA